MMVVETLAQHRRVLFTMLTALSSRYPTGRKPPVIAGIRQYLDGWPGIGRVVAGMARQQYDLRLAALGQSGWVSGSHVGGHPVEQFRRPFRQPWWVWRRDSDSQRSPD